MSVVSARFLLIQLQLVHMSGIVLSVLEHSRLICSFGQSIVTDGTFVVSANAVSKVWIMYSILLVCGKKLAMFYCCLTR